MYPTGWVYPIVSHWVWSEGIAGENDKPVPHHNSTIGWEPSPGQGWLNYWGFVDFAGSGVVHVLGGTAALVACIFIGPRTGRFDEFGGRAVAMSGHSMPLASLGGFILLFGFLAFNTGSQVFI